MRAPLEVPFQARYSLCLTRWGCCGMRRFENARTISFVPPDGDFDLMVYRLNTQVNLNLQGLGFTVSAAGPTLDLD